MPIYNTSGEPGGVREANLLDTDSDRFSFQTMNDGVALALVNSNYERYRVWRYRNCDLRWNTDDALFVGWMPQRFWEGTRIARSSLGVPISFDQIESAYPVIMNALFSDTDWFECDPVGSTTAQEAQQQRDRLQYLLDNPNDRFGNNARNEIRLAVIQTLLYGNGIINLEHDGDTGQPTVTWVDTRDVYLDPGCATPLIDDSPSTIHRDFMTLDELEGLRGSPGIKLPPPPVLRAMADQRPADTADLTKQNQEAYRNVIYRPGYDDSTDFGPDRRLEVLRYYSKARIIWTIQRRWVMYNELNPYGFVTYCSAPCYIMPGRLYGMGIPDALEGNQKYAQAILNGHLDELSLMLNPPRARSRSANMTQGASISRPGQVWEVEKPKEDLIFFPPQGVTKDGWQEIQYLEASSAKRTGVTNIVTQGMPLKSNASRTATGVQAQTTGPTTRLQAIVELIEDYMIVPMLYKMIAMDKYHNSMSGGSMPGLSPTGGVTKVDPKSLRQPVKFHVKASSRMLTQGRLQAQLPFLSQFLLNGAFLAQLAKSQQTVDFGEFFRFVQDATGTKAAYKLVRSMTPQEQQALGQPSPEAQMKDKALHDQIDERLKIANIKAQAERDSASITANKGAEDQAIEVLKLVGGLDAAMGVGTGGAGPPLPGVDPMDQGQPPAGPGPGPGAQGMLGG